MTLFASNVQCSPQAETSISMLLKAAATHVRDGWLVPHAEQQRAPLAAGFVLSGRRPP